MSDRLLTVATFQDPIAAAMAKNFLESEGIAACLIDEATIATDWMIATAIGGIKLQVGALQLERAELLLAQVRAMRDEADEEEDEPLPATGIAAQEIAEDLQAEEEDKAAINQMTDKLFRSTVFGLIFWPLQLYALYLLLLIMGDDGTVSANRRWKIWASIFLSVPLMALIVIPLLWLLQRAI